MLNTKLYIPPLRPHLVARQRLIDQLDGGLQMGHKLTLISAPAGFGKTTLVTTWLASSQHPAAWLSLDEGDNDPIRFLTYFIAALQTLALGNKSQMAPSFAQGILDTLQSPQPPPAESILASLLNEITTIPHQFLLTLDDYHLVDAHAVDQVLNFLLDHLPPQMHLVIATREDPDLPLARLRAQGHLTELRVKDLRFSATEAATFLNQVMDLNLAGDDINALETRTEGWIAGLQLAALSMRGMKDTASFIKTFTGSHHFVLDYLLAEVLQRQTASVQTFLLRTSILDRICGPLCDAVVGDPAAPGQETLEYLQQANLFIVPLDNERRWYRYHHLFADLLRQRLQQSSVLAADAGEPHATELHRRASSWFEQNGLDVEAFSHAAAANDIARAARLIEGQGMPLYYRGAAAPVLHWLEALPTTVLDERPALWVTYAWVLWVTHQNTRVAEKLQAAEAALESAPPDDKTANLKGQIAAMWAMLAANERQAEEIITHSRRALKYLHPDELPVRAAVTRTLGYAYHIQGDRASAGRAYSEAIAICQATGNIFIDILASTGLGIIQELENQLHVAFATYQRVLELVGDPPQPVACEAYFGLARITYQWNDLAAAEEHGQLSVRLARQIETIDSFVAGEIFLARLKLAQGDVAGAADLLAAAGQSVRRHNFVYQKPALAAAQVRILLRQGNLSAAAHLAEEQDLPISRARVQLAQGDAAAALALLEPLRQEAQAKGWSDQQLKLLVLGAVAQQTHGQQDQAQRLLGEALALAEPGGFIRLFVDEGLPLAQLLSATALQAIYPDYTKQLLSAFAAAQEPSTAESPSPALPAAQPLVEPLSPRELEVLQLIAQGLSNRQIGERLFIALSTVKGHNRVIFGKLQVHRRTEAVARARELGLL